MSPVYSHPSRIVLAVASGLFRYPLHSFQSDQCREGNARNDALHLIRPPQNQLPRLTLLDVVPVKIDDARFNVG